MSDRALFEIDGSEIIDGTCDCDRCTARTTATYVMEGKCLNCGSTVYGRFRKGDQTQSLTCNHCGNSRMFNMVWNRLVGGEG